MALTKTQVSELYVSIFNRASEKSGSLNWLNSGYNNDAIAMANKMLTEDAAKTYFGTSLDDDAAFVEHIYANTLNKGGADVDAAGKAGWVEFLKTGASRGEMVAKMIEAIKEYQVGGAKYATADQTTKDAAQQFANRVKVSDYTADTLETIAVSEIDSTLSFSSALNVTKDAATVTAAEAKVAKAAAAVGSSFTLTANQDNLTGTDKNDTFKAYIFDNQNTAQSGDMIDGGAGTDRLEADIGNSQNFAVSLHTTSVEQFAVRAQANNTNDSNDNNMDDNVQIDAERMDGTNWYESNNSRADVVIEDVRIKREEAYNSDSNQITKDITVAMVSTDAGDVDLDVYFDQHSLVAQDGQTKNSITLSVSNQVEATDFDAAKPLKNIPYTDVSFLVNGTPVKLNLDLKNVETYDQMWTAIQNGFNDAKAGAYSSLLANVTITRSEGTDDFISKDGITRVADEYVLKIENGSITPAVTGWNAAGGLPSTNAFGANVSQGDSSTTTNLITSTIVLDDVGRGSMGGDLVIGGMSTGDTSTSKGVEQFDIFVDRDSKLQNITSTANTLKEVYVKNRDHFADKNTTAVGSLTVTGSINNEGAVVADDETGVDSKTTIDAYGFNDVRVFDASEMKGSVNITAILSKDVVEKYMNLGDTASDNSADNAEFTYKLGTAADKLELTIAKDNLAAAGTTTREDFSLSIAGNGGNDTITTIIGDGKGIDTDAWYINSKINSNLAINAGSGNDTVTTKGAGNFTIDLGEGNDTVYTDNTGTQKTATTYLYNDGRATFVLNSVNTNINDLQSNTLAKTDAVNLGLTVTFQGITTKISEVASSFNAQKAISVTDLHVNQAIKAAIQADAVLSKLIVAEDGPSNTLIIKSLIDGTMQAADFSVTLIDVNTAALATQYGVTSITATSLISQKTALDAAYTAADTAALGAVAAAAGAGAKSTAALNAAATVDNNFTTKLATDGINTTGTITISGTETTGGNDVLTTSITDANGTYSFTTTVTAGQNSAVTANTTITDVDAAAAGYTAAIVNGVITITSTSGLAFTASTALTAGTAGEINFGALVDTTANTYTGADSTAVSDNVIIGGTGDDVIVLGTDSLALGGTSNDIIKYTGAFGNDTIVNFVAGDALAGALATSGEDLLDFSAITSKKDVDAKVAAGTVTTVATYSATDTAAQILTKLLGSASINDTVVSANSSTNVVLLTDANSATNGVATKAYVYELKDGLAINDASATLLGTITLADDGTDGQAWANIVADAIA